MRTYERTHPWITFSLDLGKAPSRLWLLIGQAQAKCHALAGVPLKPAVAAHLYRVFLAKGVLATTAIEGNTLTEEEVLKRIEGKLELPPSREYLGQEIDNIVEACNTIADRILDGEGMPLTIDTLKEFNRLALRDLPLSEEVIPGVIRSHEVVVGTYKGAPPEDCDLLTHRLCKWLAAGFSPPAGYEIGFGILRAIMAHLYLAWIHPFGDGNGRTARLAEFEILLSLGVPATVAHLLSNHYNRTRTEYYRHLDLSHKSGGEVFPFLLYALQGFVDGLDEQIEYVRGQQLHVHWTDYVHEMFRDKGSPADTRRRSLVVDLSGHIDPVPIAEVRRISPRMAEAYATKGDKTLSRDINKLLEMGLIEKTTAGIRAKKEIMYAFLPPIARGGDGP
jgi:Fic family protein